MHGSDTNVKKNVIIEIGTYQRKLSGIFETLFGLLDQVVIITMKNHFAHNLSFFQDFLIEKRNCRENQGVFFFTYPFFFIMVTKITSS